MGHRRKAREYALQGLFIYEVNKSSTSEPDSLNWVDKEIPQDIKKFAKKLITGTINNIKEIDELINKHSTNWDFERITNVDKSILRLSIFEMIYLEDIPNTVSINEGIELGKIYGEEHSSQFINGILDAINKKPGEKK